MKLSIVMRTLDRLEYTIRSIISIDEKGGIDKKDYEIIIVDQGSKDGTREWVDSAMKDGYYPLTKSIFLPENVGDGRGMQVGIEKAEGEFIAQHDSDIELVTKGYYEKLIEVYEALEGHPETSKVCAAGGSHRQGINFEAAPIKFAIKRYGNCLGSIKGEDFFYSAWVTAAFIFRQKFSSLPFGKGMCNSWCGEWWDRDYDNLICKDINFWHIDSTEKGGEYVQKQAEKFPSYDYVRKNYKRFIE